MIPSVTKVLVVDDDPDIVEFLTYNLQKQGYTVNAANSGINAIESIKSFTPHLVLLDIMMPGMDGIETCEKIREDPKNRNILVVMLTARSEDYSQIAGFNAGADDYITKPVKPKVLLSRLNAIIRRYGMRESMNASHDQVVRLNDLVIDSEKHIVFKGERELSLPRKEFKLLVLLTSRPSRVFTRDEIFEQLWGSDVFVGDRTIDVYIRKLREKLGDSSIKTIKGVGYKFEA